MASLEDLTEAIKETLSNRGVMDQLRARVRAEIFNSLEDKDQPKPQLSSQNLILNELIREYLEFNQYKHSLSVFLPETGQPKDRLQRKFLSKETNMVDDATTASVPLLYIILAKLQEMPSSSSSYKNQQQYSQPDYPQNYEQPSNHYNQSTKNNISNSYQSSTQTRAPRRSNKPSSQSFHPFQPSQPSSSSSSSSYGIPSHQSHSVHVPGNPAPLYDEDDVQPLMFTHK